MTISKVMELSIAGLMGPRGAKGAIGNRTLP
jgi:hypothetical protein